MIGLRGTGAWASAWRRADPGEAAEVACEIEDLGYSALWFTDGGGDVFADTARLLSATSRLVVGAGVLNLWARDIEDVAAGYHTVTRDYPSRYVLGLGISHPSYAQQFRPGAAFRPVENLNSFLDALDDATPPVPPAERILAALGPKMLEIARDRAHGAIPHLVTVEHTAQARAILGPDRLLSPTVVVALDDNRAAARELARAHIAGYLTVSTYANSVRRLGFGDDDLRNGGSDRLVDALVAYGDEGAVARRVSEHRAAGADHICFDVLVSDPDRRTFPLEAWRRLASLT